MIQTKRPVLPELGAMSEAFQAGYDQVDKEEYIGWPVQYAPNERYLVEFLKDATGILRRLDYDEYTLRWMAGLLAGWLRRI